MEIFGGLIEFESTEDFNIYLDNVSDDSALIIIERALKYGVANGLYNMEECYAIYKSISKLKNNESRT